MVCVYGCIVKLTWDAYNEMYVSKYGEGRWKMKKNFWILLLFIVIGLLAGALIARSLTTVPGLSFLTKTTPLFGRPPRTCLC